MNPLASISNQVPSQIPSQVTNNTLMQNLANGNNSLQLNDIHLPEPIAQYPIAIGWWLLAAIVIMLMIWLVIKFKQKQRLNKDKKLALKQFNQAVPLTRIQSLNIVKWAAMQYFDRHLIAQLFGTHFQKFLMAQLPKKYQNQFTRLSEQTFTELYQENADTIVDEAFNQAAVLWLTHALPPRNKDKANKNTVQEAEVISKKATKIETKQMVEGNKQ